jgi:RecJ-like exonuclease
LNSEHLQRLFWIVVITFIICGEQNVIMVFKIGFKASIKAGKSMSKKVLLSHVMSAKKRWREDLSAEASEFCAIVYQLRNDCQFIDSDLGDEVYATKVTRLAELIVSVRLNPYERVN